MRTDDKTATASAELSRELFSSLSDLTDCEESAPALASLQAEVARLGRRLKLLRAAYGCALLPETRLMLASDTLELAQIQCSSIERLLQAAAELALQKAFGRAAPPDESRH